VLAEESAGPMGQVDCKLKKWAGGPGDTNSPVAGVPLDHYEVGEGWVSVKITDNDRKLNINVANDVILRQALTLVGVDAGAQATIIDSILDWRDPDNQTHMSGSEGDFYKTLSSQNSPLGGPYVAKNGPIDDLTELLAIQGVMEDPDIFWGTQSGSHVRLPASNARSRQSRFEKPIYAVGLADLFTALSSPQININTASATVLQLIPEIDENIANAIISGPGGRAGPDGAEGTEDDMPFRSAQELGRIPGFGNPALVGQISRFFNVRSLVFEVQVDAHLGSYHRQYVAILRRNGPRDIQVLSFYWRTS